MGSIIAIGSAILARSGEQVEVAGRNIVNANTPGYRRQVMFSQMVTEHDSADADSISKSASDFSTGKYVVSSKSTDLAIEGSGFFVVRNGDELSYTRNGSFRRVEGQLVDIRGHAVQSADGGDLLIGDGELVFSADGTLSQNGAPVGRLAIIDFDDRKTLQPVSGDSFAASTDAGHAVERPMIRQGMIEGSNVSTGDEMVRMMAAMRSAETGQRLVQVYDDLIGRALTAFGGGGA